MLSRAWNRFKYWLERRLVRGAQYRLLLVAALIGLISVLGGAVVLALGTGHDHFGEAVWWAFLRLSDPGYLGDDVGTVNRTVSTVVTVLGYVVFLGALVAVMTQWLDARMERLESGLTPVARDKHILILGWTNRTEAIVRELLLSEERVRRFLRRHGTRDLHIVVLAEEVNATRAQDLRDAVGDVWDERKVTLRSGTALRPEHLPRVDHLNASAIILPAAEFQAGGIRATDSDTVKTLLSLQNAPTAERGSPIGGPSAPPVVVAEIFDARKVALARSAYPGPLEIVASDAIVSRLVAQNIRHRGLSHVYNQILTHEAGSEIYVRRHDELAGLPFSEVSQRFDRSIPLGVVRAQDEPAGEFEPHLNPPPDFHVQAGDRVVHLATEYGDTGSLIPASSRPWKRGRPGTRDADATERRILVLGWNHKVPALVRECSTYDEERFQIRVLARVPTARRQQALGDGAVGSNVTLEHLEGDYVELADLRAAGPAAHDTVLVVGSERTENEEDADTHTIVCSLLLRELGLPGKSTQVILELLDPENARLVDATRGEVIISPLILSHMLAHVALRPELRAVFAELFTAGGAEITFRPLRAYAPNDADAITFDRVKEAACARGEIALGVQEETRAADVLLNPPPGAELAITESTQLVTLVTYL